jgi:hypothetical protein
MNVESDVTIDLDAYFTRIGYAGVRRPIMETLRALHLAHATHIPFENLDVLLGRRILLDLESLQTKLVRGRRGGYCFEQNALFAAVLERLGFTVTRLAARVRMGVTRVLPRTHVALAVDVDGGSWLADVGFGELGTVAADPAGRRSRRRNIPGIFVCIGRENYGYCKVCCPAAGRTSMRSLLNRSCRWTTNQRTTFARRIPSRVLCRVLQPNCHCPQHASSCGIAISLPWTGRANAVKR